MWPISPWKRFKSWMRAVGSHLTLQAKKCLLSASYSSLCVTCLRLFPLSWISKSKIWVQLLLLWRTSLECKIKCVLIITPSCTDINDIVKIIASCWTDTQIADIGEHLKLTVKQRLTGSVPLNDTTNYLNSEILRGKLDQKRSVRVSMRGLTPTIVITHALLYRRSRFFNQRRQSQR